jgi:hypothetical protein
LEGAELIPLDEKIRNLIERIVPAASPWIRAWWMRHWMGDLFGPRQRLVRKRLFGNNLEPTVLSGPFRGMRYLDEIVFGSITPKWLGCYEYELWNVVERSFAVQYSKIICIGCAEGYYAVGYASRSAAREVYCFDIDPLSRLQVRRLAQMNGVSERLIVRTACSHGTLNQLISDGSLAIIDAEGYEAVLLDLQKVPNLASADILVEVHNLQLENLKAVEQRIKARFAATHQITEYLGTDRSDWMANYRGIWLGKLSSEEVLQSVDEGRSEPQHWLWMAANANQGEKMGANIGRSRRHP